MINNSDILKMFLSKASPPSGFAEQYFEYAEWESILFICECEKNQVDINLFLANCFRQEIAYTILNEDYAEGMILEMNPKTASANNCFTKIKSISHIQEQVGLFNISEFENAIVISDDWNRKEIVLESVDKYLYFLWETYA
jgi:hypothetical protein